MRHWCPISGDDPENRGRPWFDVNDSFAYATEDHPDGRHANPYFQVRWGLAYPVGEHPLAGYGRPLFDVGEHLVTPVYGNPDQQAFVIDPDDSAD